jgi:hypothetical protein
MEMLSSKGAQAVAQQTAQVAPQIEQQPAVDDNTSNDLPF